jgi:hypothetical protein
MKEWKQNGRSVGQTRIWMPVCRTWTRLRYLSGTFQESDHGLDNQRPQEMLEFVSKRKQEKALIQGLSAKKARELLNFNRTLTFSSLGLVNSLRCERCLVKEESATHILCDCEAIILFKILTYGITSWNQVTTMMPPYRKAYVSLRV